MVLNSALVLLMAEVLLALILMAAALFIYWRRKRNKEIKAIHDFLNQMEDQASFKNQPLNRLLTETCNFDAKTVKDALQNISESERELMQKVIQLFLQREMMFLNEIDRGIGKLSEPYCQLLSKLASTAGSETAGDATSLERINQQLIRQLDTAMQTIDEITSEYTRVFSGNQTELELENSSKKMLQVFNDSIRNLKHPPKE